MGAKQKTLLPAAPETREHLLGVLRSSTPPLTARELRALLAPPHQLPEREIASLLEESVAAGVLRALPPKTAKGKPRYWDRDPREVCRGLAFEFVKTAERPVTAKELVRRLPVPVKLTEAEWGEILDRHVSENKLHAIPPATSKGKRRFWGRDSLEFGRVEFLAALDAKGPQTETQLRRALKLFSDTQFRKIKDAAIAAREIWRYPAIGKVKKELFGRKPPSPEPYLRDLGKQLAKIVPELLTADFSQDDLRRTLVQLIETAGVQLTGERPLDGAPPPVAPVDLIAIMRRIEPGADRGALVVSRDLRRAARLEKQAFDRVVLELAREGRLSLHRHDFAASLSQAERDELVTDGTGTYYVGMALRQNVDLSR
jgi:hypothetical protein